MKDFVYLVAAADSRGAAWTFSLPGDAVVEKDDLLEYNGAFFTVMDALFISTKSSEYSLMDSVVKIRKADRLYACTWKGDEEDG